MAEPTDTIDATDAASADGPNFPGAFAATHPDKPAVIVAGTGETLTYEELDDEANRLARVFHDAGLRPGDHVAFCLENRAQFLAVAWGAHYAGLYYTAISTRLTTAELAYIVGDCGARVLIASPYVADAVTGDEMPNVELRLALGGLIDGFESYEDAVAAADPTPLPGRVEGMDMLYSSGTTGRPKGVKVPLPNLPLGSPNALLMLNTALFGLTFDTVYLSPAPMYHAAPLRFSMTAQRAGATVVMMERFDPVDALAAIERYRVTSTQVVPTMFVRMLKLPAAERERHDVSSLTHVIHASAPCPIPVKQQMIEWWGPVIHEYYAGTEGNGFVYTNSEDWLAHPGTVGLSLLGPLHILDDQGNELPPGEPGAVYFESASAFAYHNDPEKTAGSYESHGWSTLGDVGYVDEDGYLYLTDRKAYMIIRGGVNIYPQEAENALTMHPKVFDVAVFGVPDDDLGEEVHAVVQLAPGVEPGPDLEAELIEYCRSQLAGIKCPRHIDFRAELPRHPTGKLYKRLLKDEYWAAAGRG